MARASAGAGTRASSRAEARPQVDCRRPNHLGRARTRLHWGDIGDSGPLDKLVQSNHRSAAPFLFLCLHAARATYSSIVGPPDWSHPPIPRHSMKKGVFGFCFGLDGCIGASHRIAASGRARTKTTRRGMAPASVVSQMAPPAVQLDCRLSKNRTDSWTASRFTTGPETVFRLRPRRAGPPSSHILLLLFAYLGIPRPTRARVDDVPAPAGLLCPIRRRQAQAGTGQASARALSGLSAKKQQILVLVPAGSHPSSVHPILSCPRRPCQQVPASFPS